LEKNPFFDWAVNLLYRGATSTKVLRLILTPLLGTFFVCFILFVIFFSFYLDRLLEFPKFISRPYRIALSFPFLGIGFFLWIWSVGRFIQAKGTPVPINPPPQLVTDGPYAYTRNPMLTGIIFMLFGIGIFFGSISLVFLFAPMFAFLLFLGLKYIEEPELEKRLGEGYLEYKKRTPMIIPRIRR
jgi:protein-S-isoprenylcysteine O-methyltransferase Ste14